MLDWLASNLWETLRLDVKIFFGIGIVATLVLIVEIAFMMIGMDGDVDMDAGGLDVDGGTDAGVGYMSLRSVTAFFAGLGWAGALALHSGMGLGASTVIGVASGGAFMGMVVTMMRFMYSMRDSGTLHYENAIGEIGTVYLPIPPNQSGPGQVRLKVQGRMRVVQAYTTAAEKIPSQAKVRVTGTLGVNTLTVERLDAVTDPPSDESRGTAATINTGDDEQE